MENETIDTSHLIRSGDFCRVTADNLTDKDEIVKGDLVFVAGHRALPISEEDWYTQRIMFLCHKANGETGEVDLALGFYLIDPSSLEKVAEDAQEEFMGNLNTQIENSQLMNAESPSDEDH